MTPRDDRPGPPPGGGFPELPILAAEEARRPDRERYGALFYLGIGGLAVIVALLGWFAFGAWSLRDVWANVYVVHDPARPEAERVAAAAALAADPRVNQRQLWDMARVGKPVPDRARYLLALGLSGEAIAADPVGFARAVAESEGEAWPDWFRLLLIRPLVLGADRVVGHPSEPLARLRSHPDRAIGLWADLAAASTRAGDPAAVARLEAEAAGDGPHRELAAILRAALDGDRAAGVERATAWARDHHPGTAALWRGWDWRGGRPVPAGRPAP